MANPTGPTVASGAALISNPSASVMQVVNTPGTIMHWNGFSIAAGETTRFVQLNAASAILNRVVGASPSDILGRLESNGRVFLINPNGIVFGGGAVVDVAGLIASTRDISNADFLAGNYLFSGGGNGTITMQNGARILTSTYGPGGQVWLFAKSITQEANSSITAPQGQVVLAAGSQVRVGTSGLGNMSFTVTTDGTNTINSLGTIAADRGAAGLFADFVTHRGLIDAGSGGQVAMNATRELRIQGVSTANAPNGSITLRGGSLLDVEHDAVINADGANGRISFESNDLRVYPSGNTHAVNGQVTFNQYSPSQYAPGAFQVITDYTRIVIASPYPSDYSMPSSPAVIYRRSDGNYAVRWRQYLGENFAGQDLLGVEEIVVNASGQVVSGPATLASGFNASNAQIAQWFIQGLPATYYSFNTVPRVPTSNGGAVERTDTGQLRIYSSNGALVSSLPFTPLGGAAPLSDGSIAYLKNTPLGTQDVSWVDSNGAAVGTPAPATTGMFNVTTMLNATPDGGFTTYMTLLTSPPGVAPVVLNIGSQHWSKTVAAYTPTNSFSGDAGVASNFASRADLPQDTSVTPPPAPPAPPPVVFGSGSGARFGGVLGCNSAVCAEIERFSIAIIDSMRVAGNTTSPPSAPGPSPTPPVRRIDGEAAKRAVYAVDLARVPIPGEPVQIAYPGQPVLVYDNGSLNRLKALGLHDASEADQVAGIMAWRERERTRSSGDEAGALHSIAIPVLMRQMEPSGLRDIVRNPTLRRLLLDASAGPSL